MSTESEPPKVQEEVDSSSQSISKKAAKKEAAKKAKEERRKEAEAAASAASALSIEEEGPLANNYGDVPLQELQSVNDPQTGKWSEAVNGREWTVVGALNGSLKDQEVLIRGRVHTTRPVGNKLAFVVVRERVSTVQCLATVKPDSVSKEMVRFVRSLSNESIVDVIGVVSVPDVEIKGATQQEGVQLPRVNQDTRLNNRVIDIRTLANQGIFRIQSQVGNIFRQFLLSENFVEIHTPKLIAGSSEGGSAVFRLDYKGQSACLAQSPQLHKQMSICGDFGRVFETGPVFRAEDSYTHRHLCEFTGLDVEMEIKKHYSEVMDIVDRLFVTIFDGLNNVCKKELEAVAKQYPFEPLKYKPKTLRLTFEEGVQMLKDAGVEIDPLGDLNTESERKLGQLVLEKYGTEFYILHRYPLAVRPFYTMPCHDNSLYSNSFDVFIREEDVIYLRGVNKSGYVTGMNSLPIVEGEEIISGAQRIHIPEFLAERAQACGIDVKTISTYIDSFRYGAPPHGGFGVGLERVVMLFCGLNNIRKTSLYPRDPLRIAP
ncbi:Aspartate--tRNA ligase 2 cytoplasmic [Citrus sinensis]|nr:Aspartate--tRNA ligase 2 cytoplasmic [Citrus sinensis]